MRKHSIPSSFDTQRHFKRSFPDAAIPKESLQKKVQEAVSKLSLDAVMVLGCIPEGAKMALQVSRHFQHVATSETQQHRHST
jgi:hypothetical protein